jgi:hypothetical protein
MPGDDFMERPQLYLIGGVIVVVIVIIALALTGFGGTAQNARPGYGPGSAQPLGQGQGAGPGLGQGYGTGPGTVAPVLLPQTDATPLSATERADILFMREEEQMAHDLYTRWAGMYTVPIFSNIASSETQHVAEVRLLMDRYGLSDDLAGTASTGYHNATIQSLYATLATQGDASLNGAFEAGLAVEERDIADLDRVLPGTTRADVTQVWTNLRQGSMNHRSSFLRQLGQ